METKGVMVQILVILILKIYSSFSTIWHNFVMPNWIKNIYILILQQKKFAHMPPSGLEPLTCWVGGMYSARILLNAAAGSTHLCGS